MFIYFKGDDLINKGIDHWMKKIDISRGSKISNILKIKLSYSSSNASLNRQSNLYLFDLHLLENKTKDEHYQNGIYYSFMNIRSIVERALTKPDIDRSENNQIMTNYYVLTHLLAPFACGHHYLIIVAYIQECLHTFREEIIMVLDLIELMRSIPIISLVNPSYISVCRTKYEQAQNVPISLYAHTIC
ncbi:uncharacterized protein BX663DRAFT_518790 [Cokeromyces recurvatus]|uniref:uncharacterized protein n=1 Tax=Cokeromyces recurvatus TaxID=90255 RepID=UPI00221F6ED8|nr:uncharacterized protein BX663DRAFT_522383 [Cokeromyces recurvatus]XP_051380141.1 uncharacterized protein BX663DRAFT_518790 [Cokeromyces recurvatus]KAI7899128.1 hypothetical protein BX663DRAFT_522383 [Cokeromyces recurvatus]KAI7900156.1 hypothetical protein BX663DRAFT_518790 [Cokeromyces recurvatus]